MHFKLLMMRLQQRLLRKHDGKGVSTLNKAAHIVFLHLIHGTIPDKYAAIRKEEAELIDQEIQAVSQDTDIRRIIIDYYRTIAFCYSYGWKTDFLQQKSNENLAKAQQYDSSVLPLTKEDLTALYKSIQTGKPGVQENKKGIQERT
ncbi:MAG: hypothetical protein OEV45_16680 [Desulfobacteraceae bacterium]|nr:hypothetical protein [Desulfobacteraceae bacterium]